MRTIPFLHITCVLLGMSILLLTVPVWASDLPIWVSDTPMERATLKGVPTVDVVIEKIDSDAERDGLSRSQIQTDVELRLRQAGITVVPSSLCILLVKVNTGKIRQIEGL
jgi:hypothetical protein